jgi:hypothetical protein
MKTFTEEEVDVLATEFGYRYVNGIKIFVIVVDNVVYRLNKYIDGVYYCTKQHQTHQN